MDHHGFLTLARSISSALVEHHTTIRNRPPDWHWTVTPVVYPESKCPFCHRVVRSNGIWFLRGEKHNKLVGVLVPSETSKVRLTNFSHPHMLNSMDFCLGRHLDGVALLTSEPYLRDCSMFRQVIPMWYKKHWNHTCHESRQYLREGGYIIELKELDSI